MMLRMPGQPGVNSSATLWADIEARESFPPGTDSAFYTISLSKPVTHLAEADAAKVELTSAFLSLAYAWSFSGGPMLIVEERTTISTSRLETNASEVRATLAREGASTVEASQMVSYESLAGYRQPPLALATAIAIRENDEPGLKQLLRYFYAAWIAYYRTERSHRAAWFIDLYKVRDLLDHLHGGQENACRSLGIPHSDWSFFGKTLNNGDLRHASVRATAALGATSVNRLYDLSRIWIAAHLRIIGLSVA
jgi:hypothetical protein